MAQCLVCFGGPIPPSHVMCRSCFQEHHDVIREVQEEPIPPVALRRKLWGQQFERNRTPPNRARIAYAAHLLASAGDDELLHETERVFLAKGDDERDFAARDEKGGPLAEAASEVTHLEAAIGARDPERQQRAGEYRTKDGHWVRSKSEREIANFLFDNRITYQYERRVTIGNVDLFPDFYLPDVAKGLYLEHFGMLDDPRYRQLSERKASLFQRAGLALIGTTEEDARDFDSALQRKLGKYIPRLNQR